MKPPRRIRLFLDSNVLISGMISPWGLDKAVLALCAGQICKLVLAEVVNLEVSENLRLHAERLSALAVAPLLDKYAQLLDLMHPEPVPRPSLASVRAHRHIIRHEADVPVLLSAMHAKPDWLLTHNTKHFTPAVANRTGLRIATPATFFRSLSSLLT